MAYNVLKLPLPSFNSSECFCFFFNVASYLSTKRFLNENEFHHLEFIGNLRFQTRSGSFVLYIYPLCQKRLLRSIGVGCFVFGHSLFPLHSGGRQESFILSWGRLLLSGSVCATVVVERSMPYSQDLSWRVTRFVWNPSLTVEEAAFYLLSPLG